MDLLGKLKKNVNNLNFSRIKELEAVIKIPELNNHIKIKEIPPAIAINYKGNFYGLLGQYFKIHPVLWFIILRINDLHHPSDYKGTLFIKYIDEDAVNNIIAMLEDKGI